MCDHVDQQDIGQDTVRHLDICVLAWGRQNNEQDIRKLWWQRRFLHLPSENKPSITHLEHLVEFWNPQMVWIEILVLVQKQGSPKMWHNSPISFS